MYALYTPSRMFRGPTPKMAKTGAEGGISYLKAASSYRRLKSLRPHITLLRSYLPNLWRTKIHPYKKNNTLVVTIGQKH